MLDPRHVRRRRAGAGLPALAPLDHDQETRRRGATSRQHGADGKTDGGEGRQHHRRAAEDALRKEEPFRNGLLRKGVVAAQRAREDDLTEAAPIDAEGAGDAVRGVGAHERIVERIFGKRRLVEPDQKRPHGACQRGPPNRAEAKGAPAAWGRETSACDTRRRSTKAPTVASAATKSAQERERARGMRVRARATARPAGSKGTQTMALSFEASPNKSAAATPNGIAQKGSPSAASASSAPSPPSTSAVPTTPDTASVSTAHPTKMPPASQARPRRFVTWKTRHTSKRAVGGVEDDVAPVKDPRIKRKRRRAVRQARRRVVQAAQAGGDASPEDVRQGPVAADAPLRRQPPEVAMDDVDEAEALAVHVRVGQKGLLLVENEIGREAPREEQRRKARGPVPWPPKTSDRFPGNTARMRDRMLMRSDSRGTPNSRSGGRSMSPDRSITRSVLLPNLDLTSSPPTSLSEGTSASVYNGSPVRQSPASNTASVLAIPDHDQPFRPYGH